MFRITRYLQALKDGKPFQPTGDPPGPVVIWNLIRRCNLACKHCYSISADTDFAGELDTREVYRVMDDLRGYGVPVLILSGGEPLLRPDIFDISKRAKAMGFYVGLSTNGTLIDDTRIEPIREVGYDYVGISLDGIGATHDAFRRRQGAFDEALRGIRLCRDAGIKVGVRMTLTRDNAHQLPDVVQLMDDEGVEKFYLSHLNYGGRGNRNRRDDAHHRMTREAMDYLFDTCWNDIEAGRAREFVTGNNDADGAWLLRWVQRRFPERADDMERRLQDWGGNASGRWIANIDNLGEVHPDTFWWDYPLGNVRDRPFSRIWEDQTDPLMAGLKRDRRPLEGRCAACRYRPICGGNTRVRAWQLTGNPWAEDPACYLDDDEIGVVSGGERLAVTPYTRSTQRRRDAKITKEYRKGKVFIPVEPI